jgi:hypothetical protein
VRTYGMLRPYRLEAFAAMFAKFLDVMNAKISAQPELYDEKIVHTYGGLEGIDLYVKGWGFEVVDPDHPIMVRGKPMWRLRASLKTIQQKLQNMPNLLSVTDVDQPLSFPTTEKYGIVHTAPGATAKFLNKRGNRTFVSHISELGPNRSGFVYLGHELYGRVSTGAILAADRVVYVEQLGTPYELKFLGEIYANPSYPLGFGPDGLPMLIGSIDRDWYFAPGVWAQKGSRIEISSDRKKIVIYQLARDYRQGFRGRWRKVPANGGATIEWDGHRYSVRARDPALDSFDENFHLMITEPFRESTSPPGQGIGQKSDP